MKNYLMQNIEEIMKSIPKRLPLNRPCKRTSIKKWTPEMWLNKRMYVKFVLHQKHRERFLFFVSFYLAKGDGYENAIGFQNSMDTFKHCHNFAHCYWLRVPWISRVHKQHILRHSNNRN